MITDLSTSGSKISACNPSTTASIEPQTRPENASMKALAVYCELFVKMGTPCERGTTC